MKKEESFTVHGVAARELLVSLLSTERLQEVVKERGDDDSPYMKAVKDELKRRV